MSGFTFHTTPKIICEDGAARRLARILAGMGVHRPLIVTDKGLIATGALEPVFAALREAGLSFEVFDDVQADPPQASVEAAVEAARGAGVDGVVGLGGGSPMDTAKLVALLAATPQNLEDIYGTDFARGPRLPLVQLPTTAGTGSEVTQYAIVTAPDDQKKAVASALLYPDVAILDAELTMGLPPRVTAMTGVDAMVHAIEAYTSRLKKNPISDSLAVTALKLLFGNIRQAVTDGSNLEARRAMLQGSLAAGMAFANAPVGAVHALAYPLGGVFHAPHGLSNALVLGPVLRFNQPAARALYSELGEALGVGDADGFIAAMEALVADMPMEQRLTEIGVRRQDLERLARDAMLVTRLLVNNPREVTYDDAFAIYEGIL